MVKEFLILALISYVICVYFFVVSKRWAKTYPKGLTILEENEYIRTNEKRIKKAILNYKLAKYFLVFSVVCTIIAIAAY